MALKAKKCLFCIAPGIMLSTLEMLFSFWDPKICTSHPTSEILKIIQSDGLKLNKLNWTMSLNTLLEAAKYLEYRVDVPNGVYSCNHSVSRIDLTDISDMGVSTQSEKRAPVTGSNGLSPPPKKKWIKQHYAGSDIREQVIYTTKSEENGSGDVEFITVPAPPYIVSEVTVEESVPSYSPPESAPQNSTPSPQNLVYIDPAGDGVQTFRHYQNNSPVYTEIGQYERGQSYYVVDTKNEYFPSSGSRADSSDYQQLDCLDSKSRRTSSTTRETHNKLEKNRRAHMRECFEVLRKQLPDTEDKRLSNLGILKMACKSIQLLKRKEREMEHSIELLARDKIANQQRLALLRKEMPCFPEVAGTETVDPSETVYHEEEVVESSHGEGSPNMEDPWRALGISFSQKEGVVEDDRESRSTATASERGDLSDPEENVHNYSLNPRNYSIDRLNPPLPIERLRPNTFQPAVRTLTRPGRVNTLEEEYVVIRNPPFSNPRTEVEERRYGEAIKYPVYRNQITKVDGIPIKIVNNACGVPQVSVIRGVGVADSVVSLRIPEAPLNLTSNKKKDVEGPLRPILVRSPAHLANPRQYQVDSSSLIIHPRSTTVHPSSSSTGTPVMTRYNHHGGVILANPSASKR